MQNEYEEKNMDVSILYHTPDPERAIAVAARLCYSPDGADDLMENMKEESVASVLSTILKSGHYSALEHASYTFAVEGVSRALTHQLVRHRIASFNQQSQRYVKFQGDIPVVIPESIKNNPDALNLFNDIVSDFEYVYSEFIELGIPPEDARYILPNACKTKIVITMNVRELLHFFNLRCCNRAQWEIRSLAYKMLELVKPTAPKVFEYAGAPCVQSSCPEGKMSCGKPYKVGE